MKLLATFFIYCLLLSTSLNLQAKAKDGPVVVIKTTHGEIELILNKDKAPKTVKNFLSYVKKKFYNGTIFHRVIPNFMIQGGGFTPNLVQKKTNSPIKNESDNGLSNSTGTIAMARTSDPDSATSQFFINVNENSFLNGSLGKAGYTVFGKIAKGMSIINRIKMIRTKKVGPHQNVPVDPIVITEVTLKSSEKSKKKK